MNVYSISSEVIACHIAEKLIQRNLAFSYWFDGDYCIHPSAGTAEMIVKSMAGDFLVGVVPTNKLPGRD